MWGIANVLFQYFRGLSTGFWGLVGILLFFLLAYSYPKIIHPWFRETTTYELLVRYNVIYPNDIALTLWKLFLFGLFLILLGAVAMFAMFLFYLIWGAWATLCDKLSEIFASKKKHQQSVVATDTTLPYFDYEAYIEEEKQREHQMIRDKLDRMPTNDGKGLIAAWSRQRGSVLLLPSPKVLLGEECVFMVDAELETFEVRRVFLYEKELYEKGITFDQFYSDRRRERLDNFIRSNEYQNYVKELREERNEKINSLLDKLKEDLLPEEKQEIEQKLKALSALN